MAGKLFSLALCVVNASDCFINTSREHSSIRGRKKAQKKAQPQKISVKCLFSKEITYWSSFIMTISIVPDD